MTGGWPPFRGLAPLARAVVEVGRLLRAWRSDSAALRGAWEGAQFKARADAMAHEALAARLARIAPALPVVSEEDPASLRGARPRRYWLVDPIDGTASYAHGFAGYVTQAALMADGRAELAAIHAPEADTLYLAARGQGAWANGRRLAPRPPAPPGAGLLTDNTPYPRGIARAVQLRFGYRRYLECGSIALKTCRIAEGAAHLFVKDVPVRDWDVAAPELLLAETGGALRRLDGTPFGYRGGFDHDGLIAAADPATAAAVAGWWRRAAGDARRGRGVPPKV
ncbi:inositol monophosphatase family protein [Marinitenerispora sediminis]|uniref:inositol-phosphate phosphatase n=1 Tax=Marinitenerispora sediminis TaxID=1931232 RepID=A0A368T6V9_9ACTN|nr:inositol monophosphatase family protein [Marinitenerispora sediminis]RCV50646.1 inositol monophosphatase [Marinitenerispora sediminis]RCV56212.1 inositol monophosphatase [Marinitenerispora sediminis]RCV59443.1 inositol monophosphatase [Marinitenerispora sediminis]